MKRYDDILQHIPNFINVYHFDPICITVLSS